MEPQNLNLAPLTVAELQQVLTEILGPAGRAEVARDTPQSPITGFVAHPEFRGLSLAERRARVWEGLRDHLGPRAQEVGTLFFLSPAEYEETFGEPLNAA